MTDPPVVPLTEEERRLRDIHAELEQARLAEEARIAEETAAATAALPALDSEIQLRAENTPSVAEGSTVEPSSPVPVVVPQELMSLLLQVSQSVIHLTGEINALKSASTQSAPPVAVTPAQSALSTQSVLHAEVDNPNLITRQQPTLKVPKWGGKNSISIASWVDTQKAILLLPSVARDNTERVIMILNSLEDKAHLVASNFFTRETSRNRVVTWENMLQELLLNFGDPDQERSARAELNELRQHQNEEISSYLLRYDDITLRIPDLSDADRVSRIECGLREPHRSKIAMMVATQKTVNENYALTEDSLRALLKRYSAIEAKSNAKSPPGLFLMDTEQQQQQQQQQQRRGGQRRPRARLPKDEWQRRKEAGLCYTCNKSWGPGHICEEESPNSPGVQPPQE